MGIMISVLSFFLCPLYLFTPHLSNQCCHIILQERFATSFYWEIEYISFKWHCKRNHNICRKKLYVKLLRKIFYYSRIVIVKGFSLNLYPIIFYGNPELVQCISHNAMWYIYNRTEGRNRLRALIEPRL